MTAGSPNTPNTSSRSWNAMPRSVPTWWKSACTSGRSAAAASAQLQRTRHRVGGGLVGIDGHRRGDRLRGAGFGDDVEVLAAEQLGADVDPDSPHPASRIGRQIDARDDVVGPRQRQIAEQDGRRNAELFGRPSPLPLAVQRGELHVRGRPTPAGRRAVDHVVVHQRRGVQQFQRGEQQQRLVVGVFARHRTPAPVREGRAKPLPAAEDELFQAGRQAVVVASDVGGRTAAVLQVSPQLVGDGVSQLDGCRCFYAQRDTPSWSARSWSGFSSVRSGPHRRRTDHGPPSLFGAGLSSGFCLTRASPGVGAAGQLLRQPH